MLFTCDTSGAVRAWDFDLESPKNICSYFLKKEVHCIQISKDLVFLGEPQGHFWIIRFCLEKSEMKQLKVFDSFKINCFYVDRTFSVTDNARHVFFSIYGSNQNCHKLNLKKIKSNILYFKNCNDNLNNTAYAAKRKIIYLGNSNNISGIYNSKNNKIIVKIKTNESTHHSCCFSQNENWLFIGKSCGRIFQFCMDSFEIINKLKINQSILTLTIGNDPNILFAGTWSSEFIYEIEFNLNSQKSGEKIDEEFCLRLLFE